MRPHTEVIHEVVLRVTVRGEATVALGPTRLLEIQRGSHVAREIEAEERVLDYYDGLPKSLRKRSLKPVSRMLRELSRDCLQGSGHRQAELERFEGGVRSPV